MTSIQERVNRKIMEKFIEQDETFVSIHRGSTVTSEYGDIEDVSTLVYASVPANFKETVFGSSTSVNSGRMFRQGEGDTIQVDAVARVNEQYEIKKDDRVKDLRTGNVYRVQATTRGPFTDGTIRVGMTRISGEVA